MFHTCTISQNMYFILSGLKLTSKIKNNVLNINNRGHFVLQNTFAAVEVGYE